MDEAGRQRPTIAISQIMDKYQILRK